MRMKTLLAAGAALALPFGAAVAQAPYGSAPAPGPAPQAAPSAASPSGSEQAPVAQAPTVTAEPATEADLKAGATVSDPTGLPVGTVAAVTAQGVVLSVGTQKIQVPRNAIGKNERGLVIAVTRSQLEAAAKNAAS